MTLADWLPTAAGRPEPDLLYLLDEQPTSLVPWQLPTEPVGTEVANPTTTVTATASGSAEVSLDAPETGVPCRFRVGPALAAAVDAVLGGAPIDQLGAGERRLLRAAGVLVEVTGGAAADDEFAAATQRAARDVEARGYALVPGVLHPFVVGQLRRRVRWLVRHGAMRLGDTQSALRWRSHNEPAASVVHRQLTGLVARIVGRPVQPSYVYVASYEPGATLPPHTDRRQCEYSLSVAIDASPDPDGPIDWPLRLRLPDRDVAVYQGLGDAVLYRGRDVEHSRGRLPAHMTMTAMFAHYVDADFVGSLD